MTMRDPADIDRAIRGGLAEIGIPADDMKPEAVAFIARVFQEWARDVLTRHAGRTGGEKARSDGK
jgi:hypothetical protein